MVVYMGIACMLFLSAVFSHVMIISLLFSFLVIRRQ